MITTLLEVPGERSLTSGRNGGKESPTHADSGNKQNSMSWCAEPQKALLIISCWLVTGMDGIRKESRFPSPKLDDHVRPL